MSRAHGRSVRHGKITMEEAYVRLGTGDSRGGERTLFIFVVVLCAFQWEFLHFIFFFNVAKDMNIYFVYTSAVRSSFLSTFIF